MSGWLSNVRTRVAGRVQKGNDASFFPMLLQSKSESSEGEAEYGNSMLLPAGGSGDKKRFNHSLQVPPRASDMPDTERVRMWSLCCNSTSVSRNQFRNNSCAAFHILFFPLVMPLVADRIPFLAWSSLLSDRIPETLR